MATAPPTIFDPRRRLAVRRRMLAIQRRGDAPHYLLDDMVEDVIERLGFLMHAPARALVIGDHTGQLAQALEAQGCAVTALEPAEGLAEEQPYPASGFELVASLGTLDTVNDLPGALVHLRNALAPGGLMIASLAGAGSLVQLRAIMQEADGERPAARMHPLVDVRAGGQLLQRTGWKSPVVDSRSLTVRFASLARLLGDLRAQGLGNMLAQGRAPLTRRAAAAAQQGFAERSDADGKLSEAFELLTLSAWRP